MSANDKQVAGEHYKSSIQHWDYVVANDLDYFQAQITKYVTRWKKKNGLVDLEKAKHFIEKYIEIEVEKRKTIKNTETRAGKIDHPAPFGYDPMQEIVAGHPLINIYQNNIQADI